MSPRVAVTSVGRAASRLGDGLGRAGLTPIHLPCIRIEPAPEDVLASLRSAADAADWIVVTSSRTIAILWPDGGMPVAPAVAAVGAATAGAVRTAGGRPVIVGSGGAAVLREHLDDRVDGAVVVFPHARHADPATVEWLRDRAGRVVAGPVYTTVPIAPGSDPVDAVVFGSPSAVDGWATARPLDGVVRAAMGATTDRHLAALGHPPHIVPSTPDLAALATAVAGHFGGEER